MEYHRRGTTARPCCSLQTLLAGKYPRKDTQGYTMLYFPITEPGFRTTLQPIWQCSPRTAPNLMSCVFMLFPELRETVTGVESSLRLEVIAPAAMCALLATMESPTQLKWLISAQSKMMLCLISELLPIVQPFPMRTLPRMQAPFLSWQFSPMMAGPLTMAPCSRTVPDPISTLLSICTEPIDVPLFLWDEGTQLMSLSRQAGTRGRAYQGKAVSLNSAL